MQLKQEQIQMKREPMIRFQISLPEGLYARLEREANREGRALANYVRYLLLKHTGYGKAEEGRE